MAEQPAAIYAAPVEFRKLENTHILFWLLKDIGWCMVWRPLGLAMILPTLGIALAIAWRTRHLKSELAHNLAIVCWIVANSYWMVSEFFAFDDKAVGITTGKYLAIIPFSAGVLILLYYYFVQKPRETYEDQPEQVATL